MELIQTSPLAAQVGVKQEALQYLTLMQMGWLEIAKKRTLLFDDMTKDELAVQQELLPVDLAFAEGTSPDAPLEKINESWNKIKSCIASAKTIADTSKGQRLEFTTMLNEGVISESMKFEKRNIALLSDANAKELQIRSALVRRQNESQGKEDEKTQLRTHIQNEYFRIAAEYRIRLEQYIADGYASALRGKMAIDVMPAYVEQIRTWMKAEVLSEFKVFSRRLVNDQEAMAIYKSIPPYVQGNDLIMALNKLENKFSMYANDLANPDAALQVNAEDALQTMSTITEEAEVAASTNELMNQAGSLTVATSGSATVKTKKEVVAENTDLWAKAVIQNFVTNWNVCRQYIKIKEWSNLKIDQMAAALGKLATDQPSIKLPNLALKEIEK